MAANGVKGVNPAKLYMDHFPANAEWAHVLIGTMGEIKYERDGWRTQTNQQEVYEAALRHINQHRAGELFDPESRLPHLFHALWNLNAWAHFEIEKHPSYRDPERIAIFVEHWRSLFEKEEK